MAIVRAVKSGNWSDTTVWNTGALPTSADDVYSNTFTVTIDVSPTVLSISNAATTGVTVGGSFVPTNGITLTCTATNGLVAGSSTAAVFASSLTTGQSCSIVGNILVNDASPSAGGVQNLSSGTLTITGNIQTSSVFGARVGVRNVSTGTVNVTGQVNGATSGNAAGYGIDNAGTGTLNITGNCVSGVLASAVFSSTAGIITITGQLQASNGLPALQSTSATATNILTGPFLTSVNGTSAIYAFRWFWQNTTPPATYYQIRSANLAVIRPLYTADSVGGNPATSNVRSGTVYGPNNELTGTCAVPPAASVVVGVPVDNTTGTAAVTAASIRSAVGLASANLDTQLAAIPTTAAPTAAAIRTELDANSTRLANLDATVSSRSTYAGADTSGTTTLLSRLTSGRAANLDNLSAAPPSAGDIAAAVWAAASRTLTAAIDQSATIASAVWSAASRTITGGTVDTLTNAPTVPSAAAIASQVRTELSTELARIDASVSSRLAPSGTLARVTLTDTATTLTNAPDVPTPEEVADAVRTELTPELQRVANCATVETTGDQIAALQ